MWNACRVNNILFLIQFGGTRGQQIVTTYAIFCDHTFFQNLGDSGDRRLHQNALLEPVVLMQNSIFEKTYFFQQKSLKSIFHNSSARRGAKSWPSWRRHLTTVVSKKWFLFLVFCRPSAGISLHSSVASLPYSPHVKDCTGLGPNTLKLVVDCFQLHCSICYWVWGVQKYLIVIDQTSVLLLTAISFEGVRS